MERRKNALPRGAIVIHCDSLVYRSSAAALLGGSAHKIDFPRQAPTASR
jgi:hypothetical protein